LPDNTAFIFFCSPDGRVTECVEGVSILLGKDRGDLIQQHFRNLLASTDCEAELTQLEAKLQTKHTWHGSLVFVRNENEMLPLDVHVAPILEGGQVEQIIFIGRKNTGLIDGVGNKAYGNEVGAQAFSQLKTVDFSLVAFSSLCLFASWWLLSQNHPMFSLSLATVVILIWLAYDHIKFRILSRFLNNLTGLLKGNIPHWFTDFFEYGAHLNRVQSHLTGVCALQTSHIYRLTHFDALTGAVNRGYLYALLDQRIQQTENNQSTTLMFIDLDHFKEINDVFGHAVGDQLLIKVAKRIQALIGKQDVLGRLGGDEFGIICSTLSQQGVTQLSERVLNALAVPYALGDTVLTLSASMGIASYPQHGSSSEELHKHADVALYEAKKTGRNGYAVFEFNLAENAKMNMSLEMALREAVAKQQLVLAFQPQMDFINGRVVGFEALVRWHHPEWGIIPPDRFIPLAEKSDLIIQISDWVIDQAIQFIIDLKQRNYRCLRVSVNVSAREFWRDGFVERVKKHLQNHQGIDACCLEFELTERLAMGEPDRAVQLLRQLRELGVRLAIDDFGTGYSSLNYLRRFPIQVLKIDKSFVQSIDENEDDRAICLSIISLAKALNLETIAEGVETESHAQMLKTLGCFKAQGYHYARPMFREDTVNWLQTQSFPNPIE
jgi:diguanylate cyclase (GGDEF)-like protein